MHFFARISSSTATESALSASSIVHGSESVCLARASIGRRRIIRPLSSFFASTLGETDFHGGSADSLYFSLLYPTVFVGRNLGQTNSSAA